MEKKEMPEGYGEVIVYQTEDGRTKLEVKFEGETVWLTLDQMADLFQRDKSTISRHIKNIYSEGELDQESTVAKFATVQGEGDRQVERQILYYNLDVIISVGYRVKSITGTRFRQWATAHLKEYMIKGFTMDAILSSNGRPVLDNAGSISHKDAIEKANTEYQKYQEKTLSPVEEEYLQSIKMVEKEAKKHSEN